MKVARCGAEPPPPGGGAWADCQDRTGVMREEEQFRRFRGEAQSRGQRLVRTALVLLGLWAGANTPVAAQDVPAPVPLPDPISVPDADSVSVPNSNPVPTPDPVSVPDPVSTPDPVSVSDPDSAPEPVSVPVPDSDAVPPVSDLPEWGADLPEEGAEPLAGQADGGPAKGGGISCRPAAATQLRFKIDNDVATGQDHGYSSGLMLEVAARMPARDGLSASDEGGWMCPVWRLLGGGQMPTESVSFRLDQNLYTPENSAARYLIANDRPYAAVLMAGLAGTRLSQGQWVRNELRLGWVGPSVRGEASQNAVHKLINAPRFRGWAHQLKDEPLFELAQYRVKRWQPWAADTDLLLHWGGRLGTLQTSAYAGLEWRFGPDLVDDGGSAPLRPGANEPSEVLWHAPGPVRWTTFLTAGARAVAWDLTLDGNVSHDSHHVERRPLVFDLGAGVTMRWERWALQFMWVLRSREFDEQRNPPSFGSLQIAYTF